jgi:FKBP-type peptidyl-prolyl cis-trans isomerase (trigger factor)
LVATELKPLGSPKVLITKVAPGEAFAVKINLATLPEVKVADYKKLAKEAFGLDKKAQIVKERIACIQAEMAEA